MELTFDTAKLAVVEAAAVRPNSWNPKVHKEDDPDFLKVVASVRANGLRAPIVVRHAVDGDWTGYEIIDGEQRYRAAVTLGMPQVLIYDEGDMSDGEAQALTIWYQQQVPFDEVLEARLASAIHDLGLDIPLPYTEDELERLRKLAHFDWDDFGGTHDEDHDAVEERKLTFKLSLGQMNMLKDALTHAQEHGSSSDGHTLFTWARDYLVEEGVIEK